MDPQLYNAVKYGNQKFIRDLQSSDETTLLKVTPQTGTVLHVAARFRQKEIAELILENHPPLIRQKNSTGDTPLHIAARIGDSDMVRLLVNHKVADLEQEADEKLVQIINMKGETALHEAVRGDHLEVVKLLIEKDPLLATVTTVEGESPLFLAVERMHTQVAVHILSHAPSCSFQGRNKMNALHEAIIRSCDLGFIKKLLAKSPSAILEADNSGRTALHHAVRLGKQSILEELLSTDNSNSIACAKDKEGMTALHIAAKEGRVDIMQKLAQKCPDIWDLVDNKGQTALHVATKIGKAKIVKFILKEGPADIIKQQDNEGNSSLHLAASGDNFKIVELLIEDRRVDEMAINKKGVAFMDILVSDYSKLSSWRWYITRMALAKILCLKAIDLARLKRLINERNEREMLLVNEAAPTPRDEIPAVPEKANGLAYANEVVATLIATVSFTAAVTVPGGYISKDEPETPAPSPPPRDCGDDCAGTAVLFRQACFNVFIIANSLAFAFSLGLLLSQFLTSTKKKERRLDANRLIRLQLLCSVICLLVAYVTGTYAVLPHAHAASISSIAFCLVVSITVGLEELLGMFEFFWNIFRYFF